VNSPRRVCVLIAGTVQGVFFRQSAKSEAIRLGLTGWIRNRPDGKVEAVAEGAPEAVDGFVAWCRIGPPAAEVDSVEVTPQPATGQFSAFRIEH